MITARLDMGPLAAKLRRISLELRKPLEELTEEQARLFVSSTGKVPGMVQVTPPHSAGVRGRAAQTQGVKRVRADLAKVYANPGTVWADIGNVQMKGAFWRAVKAKDWARAESIMRAHAPHFTTADLRDFDDGKLHWQLRSRTNGRVTSKRAPVVLREPKAAKSYRKRKEGNVGIYASGFNSVGARMGARGVPAWIKNKGVKYSGVTILRTGTGFWIVMDNRVPFGLQKIMSRAEYVLGYRLAAMKRAWPYVKKAALRRAGIAA